MAKPGDVTGVRGVKDTADVVSQEKPLAIGDTIWMHDPNRNKLLAWAFRNGKTVPTFNHTYGHLEDVPFSGFVEFAGADESSQLTTGLVLKTGHGARVTLGSRIMWARTKEVTRLTAVMSTDTTGAVNRNNGRGASTDLLQTGDIGLLITPSFEQGFTSGGGFANSMVFKSFNTTEMSLPVQTTFVENAEKSRGGNPFARALRKTIKQAKDMMEAELIYGAALSNDSFSPHPISTSTGFDEFVTTNVYTANTMTRMDLWDILAEWTAINKEGGAIFCSMAFKSMVAQWSLGQMVQDQSSKKDGLDIDQILTPFGLFDLVEVDLLNQEENLMGSVYFVPRNRIHYRPLIHDMNLDIKYRPIERDEVHSKEGELYGVTGWEFFEEELWAKITGLDFTGAAA